MCAIGRWRHVSVLRAAHGSSIVGGSGRDSKIAYAYAYAYAYASEIGQAELEVQLGTLALDAVCDVEAEQR